jgi:hypothetical protein
VRRRNDRIIEGDRPGGDGGRKRFGEPVIEPVDVAFGQSFGVLGIDIDAGYAHPRRGERDRAGKPDRSATDHGDMPATIHGQ